MTHTRSSGSRPRGLLLLLPLLGVVAVMALTPPPASPTGVPAEQRFDRRLQAPRFVPWWHGQLRQAFGAARRSRALLAGCRTPDQAALRRRALAVTVGDYNRIAQQAPPAAFTGPERLPPTLADAVSVCAPDGGTVSAR